MGRVIRATTCAEAWLKLGRAVLELGGDARDGGEPIRELLHVALEIRKPREDDPVIRKLADPKVLDWMRSNFREKKLVPELQDSPSYAMRLEGRLERAVAKLKSKPETKSATLSTLRDDDTGYVPCVSLLDFKRRGGGLVLTAACRSIDAGVKLPANLVELAAIQSRVAAEVGATPASMVVWIASAHVYRRDEARVKAITRARPMPRGLKV